MFLGIKKNAITYLRESPGELAIVSGEFCDAPYLNVHGETERDLRLYFGKTVLNSRTGQPQYLSQDRYDKVRTALLNHAIEMGIARRLESYYDPGVWLFLLLC